MMTQRRQSLRSLMSGCVLAIAGMSSALANPALYYAAPRCGYNNQVVVTYRSGSGYAALNTTTASNAANCASSIRVPARRIRSLKRTRCGLV